MPRFDGPTRSGSARQMFLNPRRPGRSQLTGAGRATTWQPQVGDRMAGQPELDIAAMISQQVPFRSIAPTRSYGRFGLGDRFSGLPRPRRSGPTAGASAAAAGTGLASSAPRPPSWYFASSPSTVDRCRQRPHSCPRKGLVPAP